MSALPNNQPYWLGSYDNSALPTGMIMMWPIATAPQGFIVCDGSAVSRTTYASLFAVIGTTYGVGNGTSTFNLPNTAGNVIRGYNGITYTTAGTGGADTYALLPSNVASHKHDLTLVQNGIGSTAGGISTATPPASAGPPGNYAVTGGAIYNNSITNGIGTPAVETTAGANGASFSLVNKYLVLYYIIKYL